MSLLSLTYLEKLLGILFTGGEAPKPEKIKQLLDGINTKTLLAAADSGLALAEAAGIRPDWIIGDMDSLCIGSGEERLHNYPAQRIIRHPQDKDYTDTELALALLWEKGCDETWIIGGGGGRLDHLLAIRDLFERDRFPSRWFTANNDVYCIEAEAVGVVGNNCNAVSLNVKGDEAVSVFPVGAAPWEAKSQGLKWPLDKVRWERGFYGLSNTAISGHFSITAYQGRFMVIVPSTVFYL